MADEQRTADRTITVEEMEKALAQSGYFSEVRVFELLRESQLTVETNVPYSDPSTGKTRESDFRASLSGIVHEVAMGTTLIGECTYSRQPLVFMMSSSAESPLLPILLRTEPSYDLSTAAKVADALGLRSRPPAALAVATQFCTFDWKERGKRAGNAFAWSATHGRFSEKFESLVAALGAYLHFTGDTHSSFFTGSGPCPFKFRVEIIRPVLVLSGGLFTCTRVAGRPRLSSVERVAYRSSIRLEDRVQDLTIDVVTEKGLTTYVDDFKRQYSALAVIAVEKAQVVGELLNRARDYFTG